MSNFIVGVVQFPGTNCELETHQALQRAGLKSKDFFWNNDIKDLETFDALVIPGGFSYEDRGRSGLIAAKLPVMQEIRKLADKGMPIFGICNGAQVLVESGLVPGFKNYKLACALTENERRLENGELLGQGYINDWCYISPDRNMNPGVFGDIDKAISNLKIPFAHAEGKFVIPDDVYKLMLEHKVPMWRYCDDKNNIDAHYPVNPNGSCHNLAAIGNFSGNVLAMMPHPERVLAGDAIFKSLFNYLANKENQNQNQNLNINLKPEFDFDLNINQRSVDDMFNNNCLNWLVREHITDNQAQSVEMAIRQHGLDASVIRTQCFKISFDNNIISKEDLADQLIKAGVCFNPNKAGIIDKSEVFGLEDENKKSNNNNFKCNYMVTQNTDVLGERVLKESVESWGIKGINKVESSMVWSFVLDHDQEDNANNLNKSEFENKVKDLVMDGFIHNCFVAVGSEL